MSSFGWARMPAASAVVLEKALQLYSFPCQGRPCAVLCPVPPARLSAPLVPALGTPRVGSRHPSRRLCPRLLRRGWVPRQGKALGAAGRAAEEPVVPVTLGLMEMS